MVARVSLVTLSITLLLHFCPLYEAMEVRCEGNIVYTDAAPYQGLPLPVCGEDLLICMTLYTRTDNQTGQPVTRSSLPSTFDGSLMTFFIVHGYLGCTADQPWMYAYRDNILKKGNYNVILVSWPLGAINPNYAQSASNTRSVGMEIGLAAQYMLDAGGSAKERLSCAGHSLGSHVCGHAGARTKLGRIVGIDPAGPLFQDRNWTCGLNPSCADRVDAIHTGGQGSPVINFGTMKPLGHVDFYPNGAGPQPECGGQQEVAAILNLLAINLGVVETVIQQINGAVVTIQTAALTLTAVCNHFGAVFFFQESIISNCFLSTMNCTDQTNLPGSCESTSPKVQPMGFAVDNGQDGIFYLTTNVNPPYCQGLGSGT